MCPMHPCTCLMTKDVLGDVFMAVASAYSHKITQEALCYITEPRYKFIFLIWLLSVGRYIANLI